MAMFSTADYIGRPYVAPPGLPRNSEKACRKPLWNVLKDPEMRKDAKKNQMELEYVPPEQILKLIQNAFSQPEDVVKTFSKYVKF